MNDLTMTNQMPAPRGASAQAIVAREVQEVQGAIIAARMYPRDPGLALRRIEDMCSNVRLAENAMYEYRRGGQPVTGPSIRLAEAIAQQWGNFDFGYREVERGMDGGTEFAKCVATAKDYETNVSRRVEFMVMLVRETQKETKALTSQRDIYEFIANQAARRMRSCILALIPAHVVDAAIVACEKTLANAGTIEERRNKIVEAFKAVHVSVPEIEHRLGKKITGMSSVDYVQLRKILGSLQDGASEKGDWFEPVLDPAKIKKVQTEAAAAAPAATAATVPPAQDEPPPPEAPARSAAPKARPEQPVVVTPEAKREATSQEADRRAALVELGREVARVMEQGGSATTILRLRMDVAHICQDKTNHTIDQISAMTDALRAWPPAMKG